MRGLTTEEYQQIVDTVNTYHRFGHYLKKENRLQKNGEDFHMNIKYIDTCYDTRDNSIWLIKFRGFGKDLRFSVNHFAGFDKPDYFKFDSLFDWVMAFLKGEWNNNNILKQCLDN